MITQLAGKILAGAILLVGTTWALHVVQILDSVILEKNDYLILSNFNDANFMSDDSTAFNQTVDVKITNNFENFKFDVFIFEGIDEESRESDDLRCYKEAVSMKNWDKNCDFKNVTVYKNRDDESYTLKRHNETNDKDRIIVIDNTPLPADGSFAQDVIILEYASSTLYKM